MILENNLISMLNNMKTTIGSGKNAIIIEKDSISGINKVIVNNPLIPAFYTTWTDSTIVKFKRKYGLFEGMRKICLYHLKINWQYNILPPEIQADILKAYRRFNKAYRLMKKIGLI